MRTIAWKSIKFAHGRTLAAVTGVALAVALFLIQSGLYIGFAESAGALVKHVGGDVWVMARGTPSVEYGELLDPGVASRMKSIPCVRAVRPLVVAFPSYRLPGGGIVTVELVGAEAARGQVVPWSLVSGLPGDLAAPDRVTVDQYDARKLGLEGELMGQRFYLGRAANMPARAVFVAGVTGGIRSFTLTPYMFAQPSTVRKIAGIPAGAANFWIADLEDKSCASDVLATLNRERDAVALGAEEFLEKTQAKWLTEAGIGFALGMAAILGLVVGVVVLAQTTYAVINQHIKELATWKALGASDTDVVGFVIWQGAFFAVAGGVVGTLVALGVAWLAEAAVNIEIPPALVLVSGCVNLAICTVACVASVRRVMQLSPTEVLR